MNRGPGKQKGASAIVTLILLVALGFAAYVGIQYVPQAIESKSIDSILETMQSTQNVNPVQTVQSAQTKLIGLLQINEMDDMTDSFTIEQQGEAIVVNFSYDRELNLLYKKHPMHYEKSLRIR